jgi:NTE family protein
MNGSPSRALVLGGGGSCGNAWLIGVLAGLAEAGLDVTGADLIVGTSAGATAVAQLGLAPLDELMTSTQVAVPSRAGGAASRPAADPIERLRTLIAASSGIADFRRRVGASSLAAAGPEWSRRWRQVVAARLPGAVWPERRILITAVDAESGEPVDLDATSGVTLVDAVAASTSGGPAFTIGDRAYIDGGYRANSDNADLAAGHDRVLVLSPLGGRSLHPVEWGTHLAGQVDALRAAGSVVETVFPDGPALAAFGDDMMNLSRRPAAARAGHAQGVALSERIARFWDGERRPHHEGRNP